MNKAIEKLIADGWKEYIDVTNQYARCFYKYFDTQIKCHCNNDKPGIQISIHVYEDIYGHSQTNFFELVLSAELEDTTWFGIKQWSLTDDLDQVLSLIPDIIKTWEYMNIIKRKNV